MKHADNVFFWSHLSLCRAEINSFTSSPFSSSISLSTSLSFRRPSRILQKSREKRLFKKQNKKNKCVPSTCTLVTVLMIKMIKKNTNIMFPRTHYKVLYQNLNELQALVMKSTYCLDQNDTSSFNLQIWTLKITSLHEFSFTLIEDVPYYERNSSYSFYKIVESNNMFLKTFLKRLSVKDIKYCASIWCIWNLSISNIQINKYLWLTR